MMTRRWWPPEWTSNDGSLHIGRECVRIRWTSQPTTQLWLSRSSCAAGDNDKVEEPKEVEAARIVREHWPFVDVREVRALPSYDDSNFLVVGDKKYVLKIAAAGAECRGGASGRDTLRALECECRMMRRLRERGGSATAPEIFSARCGAEVVPIDATRFARLIEFMEGSPFSAEPKSDALLARFGTALADCVAALEDFDDGGAADARPLAWDLRNARDVSRFEVYAEDSERREMARRALKRFGEIGTLPRAQTIHGDANDENVIIGKSVAFIDFGDFVVAPRVYELAIALAYALMGGDARRKACLVVAAFHARLPLDRVEVEALIPLVAARNCQTALNAARRLAIDPTDAYVSIHAEPAWRLLANLDVDEITKDLLNVCGFSMSMSFREEKHASSTTPPHASTTTTTTPHGSTTTTTTPHGSTRTTTPPHGSTRTTTTTHGSKTTTTTPHGSTTTTTTPHGSTTTHGSPLESEKKKHLPEFLQPLVAAVSAAALALTLILLSRRRR